MTTIVTNTILLPDDSPATHGRVRIQLSGVGGEPVVGYLLLADDSAVEGNLRLGVDEDGVWSTELIPNSLITPAGTVYRVIERRGAVVVNDVAISVPNTAGTFELADLITDFPGDLPPSSLSAEAARAQAAEAALAAAISAVEASDVDSVNGRTGAVAGLAEQADLDAEAAARVASDAALQPLDSDLTAIAALSTTPYGRAFLALADAAAGRTALELGTAATQATGAFDAAGAAAAAQAASQPADSDLTAIAALSTTTYGRALLTLADAAAGRTALGLGSAATQASSAFEPAGSVADEAAARDSAISVAIAALVNSAPGVLDTLEEIADALGDDPNFAATMTTALAGKQPVDSDLTAIAALTTTAFGRSTLEAANAAALRALAGLGSAAVANTGDFDAAGAAAAAQAAAVQRANHTGTQSADTLTDGTTNKAFLATERTKLAGVATGATANDTDANLKARANHTGTQLLATISDAGTAAALAKDTDGALAANSDTVAATQKAVKTYADAKVVDAINDAVTTSAPSQNAVFDALALKAPLASPALTGNPTAPTAARGDNDTSLATTAFVADSLVALLSLLTTGQETIPRLLTGTGVNLSTQTLRLSYFTARKTETITQVRLACSTGAVGTPSLIRVGIYTVAGNGDLTLAASTANDTTLLAANSTTYTKALQASLAVTAGTRYAVGVLVVTVGTAPQIVGSFPGIGAEDAVAPRISAVLGSQTDLPTSPTEASLTNSSNNPYVVLLP